MQHVHKGKIRYKSLVDFYLTSSSDFQVFLKQVDANNILQSIEVPYENNGGVERFNESILRILCLNQAIEKMFKEAGALVSIRNQILEYLEQRDEPLSTKLANFILKMRSSGNAQPADSHPMAEFDHNFIQIDNKLNRMMNYMNKVFTDLPEKLQ